MPYPIERKLVIAVASSALFDLRESDKVFIAEGPKAYKEYQEKNLDISRHVPETFKLFISKEGVGIFALDKSNSEIHNEVQMNFYSYAGF